MLRKGIPRQSGGPARNLTACESYMSAPRKVSHHHSYVSYGVCREAAQEQFSPRSLLILDSCTELMSRLTKRTSRLLQGPELDLLHSVPFGSVTAFKQSLPQGFALTGAVWLGF